MTAFKADDAGTRPPPDVDQVLRIRPLNLIRYLYKNKNKFY
jgi:hypothetical protein